MKYRVRIKNPIIGVPITFLDKLDPNQFEIIGIDEAHGKDMSYEANWNKKERKASINGKETYARIFIRWKTNIMPMIDKDGVILYEI